MSAPKTRAEIDALILDWRSDPCWDLEDAPGFEAHKDELRAVREKFEAERAARRAREHEAEIQALMKPALALLPLHADDGLSRTVAETAGSTSNILLRMVAEMLLPIAKRLDRLDERQETELRKLEEHVDQQVRRLDGR